jgi:hypothetical protein
MGSSSDQLAVRPGGEITMDKRGVKIDGTTVERPVVDFLSEKFPDFTDEENLWLVNNVIETAKPFLPKVAAIKVWLCSSQSTKDSLNSGHCGQDSRGRSIRITFETSANIDDEHERSLKLYGAIEFKYPPQIRNYFRCELTRVVEP